LVLPIGKNFSEVRRVRFFRRKKIERLFKNNSSKNYNLFKKQTAGKPRLADQPVFKALIFI
jgi:hypothetical protein